MGSFIDPANLMSLLYPTILSLMLIISRVIGLLLTSPFFDAPQIPSQVKALFTLIIALLLLGPVGIKHDIEDLHVLHYTGLIFVELGIGGMIGLVLMLIFSGIEFAGRLFGIQMGFAVANVVDPTTSQQIGVLSQLIRFIFLFVFFAIDGHLMLLQSLFVSFKILKLGGGTLNIIAISDDIIGVGSHLFRLAMRIALPISCSVLLINTGLAALARTTPQMNIFMVGFMLNIGAGLFMLIFAIPSFVSLFKTVIFDTFSLIGELLRQMG
jgi:flagellar biosynthetic protein FliR